MASAWALSEEEEECRQMRCSLWAQGPEAPDRGDESLVSMDPAVEIMLFVDPLPPHGEFANLGNPPQPLLLKLVIGGGENDPHPYHRPSTMVIVAQLT